VGNGKVRGKKKKKIGKTSKKQGLLELTSNGDGNMPGQESRTGGEKIEPDPKRNKKRGDVTRSHVH